MSRQGDHIVTTTKTDKVRIKVWSAMTGQELLAIDEQRELLNLVALSPDGAEILVIGKADETATTYDSRTGQLRRTFKLASTPCHATYSPSGDCVVFIDTYGNVDIYGAKSGTFIGKVEGCSGDSNHVKALPLPGSQTLLIRDDDNRHLHLYNIQDLLRIR
ncbi:uncharacterized protein PHACADRAFT_248876 [Phanerochaete carnosa HHB-10118-sp]|uniref:Uncharacterized protein n=1 Tax=Phanerochaete carnosa (strain HHB-10118-sp) TaxID=650164 RepID=K5WHJ9_PHACS|nr:uncharacterized protein PHACADRAFT_248876 [Phanerochaete carnosa HHB-10118-sp]EKM58785.1 hypothetical protein PHACADRAFT_248876 [Phanerochaete carnosa HHB-10118-sp]